MGGISLSTEGVGSCDIFRKKFFLRLAKENELSLFAWNSISDFHCLQNSPGKYAAVGSMELKAGPVSRVLVPGRNWV